MTAPNTLFLILVTVAVGIVFSVLLHLAGKYKAGSYAWVADTDQLSLYLPVAAALSHGEGLRRSYPVSNQTAPALFPWVQNALSALLARALWTKPLPVRVT